MMTQSASTASGALIIQYAYSESGPANDDWYLEKAGQIGKSIPTNYSKTNSDITRCYPFGMYLPNLSTYLNVQNYAPGDSVDVTAGKVKNHFNTNTKLHNRSVRQISKNDLIRENNEFKMVLKTYTTKDIFGNITGGDYHFMIQCSNGTWANKLSYLNSENLGYIDPSSGDWNYGGIDPSSGKRVYGHAYTDGPVYFAVTIY